MVCSIVPEVFTDFSRPSAELTLTRLFQVYKDWYLLTSLLLEQCFVIVLIFASPVPLSESQRYPLQNSWVETVFITFFVLFKDLNYLII